MDLKPDEIICDKCNGQGDLGMNSGTATIKIKGQTTDIPFNLKVLKCDKCYGAGKLDWIEAVVGRKQEFEPWYPSAGFKRGTINAIKTK